MPLTEIEELLFGGLDFSKESPFLKRIKFADETVALEAISVPGNHLVFAVKFPKAVMTSVWLDEDESLQWPLDLMHFDSYQLKEQRWKFVLNCGNLELVWESDWPLSGLQDSHEI